MLILRDIRALAPLIPTKRFHEKPPLFMSLGDGGDLLHVIVCLGRRRAERHSQVMDKVR
jgi:hypothetical protein